MKMRVPLVYTASEVVNWHVSEQDEKGKWRPARPCPFWSFRHIRQQFRIAWAVFIGELDALQWGESSGANKPPEAYRDCTDPRWLRANKMVPDLDTAVFTRKGLRKPAS